MFLLNKLKSKYWFISLSLMTLYQASEAWPPVYAYTFPLLGDGNLSETLISVFFLIGSTTMCSGTCQRRLNK